MFTTHRLPHHWGMYVYGNAARRWEWLKPRAGFE